MSTTPTPGTPVVFSDPSQGINFTISGSGTQAEPGPITYSSGNTPTNAGVYFAYGFVYALIPDGTYDEFADDGTYLGNVSVQGQLIPPDPVFTDFDNAYQQALTTTRLAVGDNTPAGQISPIMANNFPTLSILQANDSAVEQSFTGHAALPVYFNANGVLSYAPTPTPTPTTTDYTQSQLSTLLTNDVSSVGLTRILNHFPNGAVVETDTNGPYHPLPDVTDSSGNQPNLLLLDASGNTIDLDNLPHVHNIVATSQAQSLTIDGATLHANLYLQPVGSGGFLYQVTDNAGTLHVFGQGASLILDDGGNQVVTGKDGGNVFNAESGVLTLKLGGDNNVVNVTPPNSSGALNAIISGLNATDVVNFNLPQADYSITKTTDTAGHKITEITGSAGGGFNETVTMNGWHVATTFASDPTIHYI